MPILDLFAIIAVFVGTFFSVVGVLGFRKFPDVYTRMHATGKVGVFGVVLLLIAIAVDVPQTATRAIVIIVMLLIVGPVTAHSLASAAHRSGIQMDEQTSSSTD